MKKMKLRSRIRVLENKRIDIRNSVVLIEADDAEYLVLLSPSQPVVLSTKQILNKETIDET
ncbi:MAG: hypothetical protein ACK5N8_02880 [Alphaproteobacteria bacterium]